MLIKVVFVTTYVSGVQFYRVKMPVDGMTKLFKRDKFVMTWYKPDTFEMERWEWQLYEPDKTGHIYAHLDAACRWADVVVWMGLHTPKALDLFVHMRAKHGKPFVSEFDDFIFSIPKVNSAFGAYKPGTEYTRIALEQIKRSDALIVSTPHLKEIYKPFNNRVYCVENAIDNAPWKRPRTTSPRQGAITIGWMGGGTHNEDHEMIQDAVLEVLDKCPNARFTYISGCPPPKKYEGVKRLKWTHAFKAIDKYPGWIARQGFDIGIAPLVDNEFNRAKSNLRWLEYSAMGIPTVASPLLHFKQSIRHGKTGFLASSHAEWVKILTMLVNEPDVRENVGAAARQSVIKDWNPQVQAKKYRAALGAIADALTDA